MGWKVKSTFEKILKVRLVKVHGQCKRIGREYDQENTETTL